MLVLDATVCVKKCLIPNAKILLVRNSNRVRGDDRFVNMG